MDICVLKNMMSYIELLIGIIIILLKINIVNYLLQIIFYKIFYPKECLPLDYLTIANNN